MTNLRLSLSSLLLAAPLAFAACKSGPEARPADTASAAASASDQATAQKLQTALAAPHRSEKNRARDAHRHPAETLTFFGLRDDMTVVELWPGGGWYTEVLAPVLKDRGKLVVTSFDLEGPPDAYATKRAKELKALLDGNPEVFGQVQTVVVNPPDGIDLGPPGSADLVLTFRNLHNWMTSNFADKVLAAAFTVLKPGGVLGVVEHRANPGQDLKSGYVEEAAAIRLAEAAGFKLAGRSEVNANPKDTKDHPNGVWSLPPNLRVDEKDKERYAAIGESDRMTLKFVKP